MTYVDENLDDLLEQATAQLPMRGDCLHRS